MDDRPVCWVCKRVIRHETREDWERRLRYDYWAQAADACSQRVHGECTSVLAEPTARVEATALDRLAEIKTAGALHGDGKLIVWAIARWFGTYDNPEVAVRLALPQWTLEHRSPRDEHGGEWWLLARRE